jgi:hypothetical protein
VKINLWEIPMTRATSYGLIGVLVLLGGVLTACELTKDATDPALSDTFAANASVDAQQLVELRKVTSRFHQLEAAQQAGYDAQITPCWAHHSAGAMGYHYGKPALIDATVDLLEPEVVMYEPQAGGHMRLVGMEYIVPLAAWEAAGHDLNDPADVPELLGQRYTRHSFLPIFKLHIWLWRANPSGVYADWNPKVSCANAENTEVF